MVILYKLYNADSENNFQSEAGIFQSYLNGRQAFDDLTLVRGYRPVLNADSSEDSLFPSLDFRNFPGLFTDVRLQNGFSSNISQEAMRLVFRSAPPADEGSLELELYEAGLELAGTPEEFKRQGDGNERLSFEDSLSNYLVSHPDLPDGGVAEGDFIQLSLVIFGYRSTFGEGGQQFSLPSSFSSIDIVTSFQFQINP